ncbi:hypothetical protein ACTMTJ_20315 [Phytohabitans sp. LJ34]|uniref:hypothetical protein n=1 Tax=Phytohabitans sp. LJ34 TaxID=3452217 RepID=UPI003F8C5FD7
MDGTCESIGVDWNPIGSAGLHSQLTGVVASLVFAGIVVILERRSPTRRSLEALALFVVGFFTFALDSFFFAVVAGERTCARAWTETMIAAGLLGFGALGLFAGVAWLLRAHGESDSMPFRITRVVAYALAVIVVGQLTVTARDYLRDVTGDSYPGWIGWLLNSCLALSVVAVAAHAAFNRRIRHLAHRAVELAAYVSIAYIVICAAVFGVLTGLDKSYWEGGTRPTMYVPVTLISIIVPTLVVMIQLMALPHHDSGSLQPVTPDDHDPAASGPAAPDEGQKRDAGQAGPVSAQSGADRPAAPSSPADDRSDP